MPDETSPTTTQSPPASSTSPRRPRSARRVFGLLAVALALVFAWPASADARGRSKKRRKRPAIVIPAEDAGEAGVISADTPQAPAEPAPAESSPAVPPRPEPSKPARPETVATPIPAGPTTTELAALRAEYESLRDALFRTRARAQAVDDATQKTRLALALRWKAPRGWVARSAELRLDGAPLWTSPDALGDAPVALPERGLAPGRHVLSVRLEIRASADSAKGYASEQTFVLDLAKDRRTEIEVRVDEDGDLPEYEPDIRILVESD